MMHHKRTHYAGSVPSARDLAEKLTTRTWCLCTGFHVEGHPDYLVLNDSTNEDAAAEFGIIKRTAKGFIQLESITFSWCSFDQALKYIEMALAGQLDAQGYHVTI